MEQSKADARELLECIVAEIHEAALDAEDDMAREARIDPENANFYSGKTQGLTMAAEIIANWSKVLN
jgi:hypothetical protein